MNLSNKSSARPFTCILFLLCLNTYRALYPMGVPAAAAGVASVAAVLGTPLRILLTALNAAREGTDILKSIQECVYDIINSDFWHSSHSSQKQEMNDRDDEERLRNNPSLRLAQQHLAEKAIGHLLMAYSPKGHPCERIEALFSLNRIKLLGHKGSVYRECLATINRQHFSSGGTLRGYDPSASNYTQPKRVREVAVFLKTLCRSQEHYKESLGKGIDSGITALKEYLTQGIQPSWQQKNGTLVLNYATQIVQKMTGFDLSALQKVEQALVLDNRTNREFMKVIYLSNNNQCALAIELIEKHRSKHNGTLCPPYEVMKRYCKEMQVRNSQQTMPNN